MLIFNRTRISLLILFAAGTKQPTWDFISYTPHICHGHNILLIFSCCLKRIIYISEGCLLPLWQYWPWPPNKYSAGVPPPERDHQQFHIWNCLRLVASGEDSFVEWIHQWLICGWCGPCGPLWSSDCVGTWQSYYSVAIETARAFGGILDDKRNKYKLNHWESASYQLRPWDNKSPWNAGKCFEQSTYLYLNYHLHTRKVEHIHLQWLFASTVPVGLIIVPPSFIMAIKTSIHYNVI